MSKRITVLVLTVSMTLVLSGCSSQDTIESAQGINNPKTVLSTASSIPKSEAIAKPLPSADTVYSSSSFASSEQTVSFTNSYGTSSTICAEKGCNRLIASSGDTNCCTIHSNNCKECGNYIDSDATYCMTCIEKATKQTVAPSKSNSSYSTKRTPACGHESCATGGPFNCMGKNNTCPNTTSCAYDFYCSSCD